MNSRLRCFIGRKRTLCKALFILTFLLLISASPAFAGAVSGDRGTGLTAQAKSWDFERFDSEITINKDGSFTVRETQVVNFTGNFHFLERFLTTRTADFSEGRTYGKVRYKDINVYDLDGKSYDNWKVKSAEGGKTVRIEFDVTNEQKGWIIEYRVTGAIVYSPDYDRFYYNVVSVQRDVPVKESRATLRFPAGTDTSKIDMALYLDEAYPPTSSNSGREGDLFWWEAKGIPPGTTYTIDLAFPKGTVELPWQFSSWFGFLMIGIAALVFAVTLGSMLIAWWVKGRDVGRPELDVVRYLPPEDLKPAEVGMLIHEKPSPADISATIVDLAIRGKLTIFEEESKHLKRKKYGFKRITEEIVDLSDFERVVMEGLFNTGAVVTEDDLKDKFYSNVAIIGTMVSEAMTKKDMFLGDPGRVRAKYGFVGLLTTAMIPAVLYILNRWFEIGKSWYLIPGFAAAGIIIWFVGRYMPRKSRKGSEAYSYVMGFKEYMETAEDAELEYMTPENFQTNLPYAMVLGVSEKWAKKFENIYVTPPAWFEGSYTTFNTVYLAGSLGHMVGSMNGTLTSSPSSSGGGGFGGGSSGGGFGGGGSSAG